MFKLIVSVNFVSNCSYSTIKKYLIAIKLKFLKGNHESLGCNLKCFNHKLIIAKRIFLTCC